MTCREKIISEEVYDYITDFPVEDIGNSPINECYEKVDEDINIVHLDKGIVPGPDVGYFEYQSIPCLYGLLQEYDGLGNFNAAPLISSGIIQAQNSPYNLTGKGVLICFIDTGIDFTLPHFMDEFGQTRIVSIWDQSDQSGNPPEGYEYGTEYTDEEINKVINGDSSVYIPIDENGHGTKMAAVCASSKISNPTFVGAAPEAEILVVKLKAAKRYLREFYMVQEGEEVFQENDICLGIKYAAEKARLFSRPVVICLGLGTSIGDHGGNTALSVYIDKIATKRNRAVVVGAGNMGDKNLHFEGSTKSDNEVEINVEKDCSGFFMEFWGRLPNIYSVTLISPGGEELRPVNLDFGQSITYGLTFEETEITIQLTKVEAASGKQLIIFKFDRPTAGIWRMYVSGDENRESDGSFDLWISYFYNESTNQYSKASFLRPSPNITITEPGYSRNCICVGAYNSFSNGILSSSGRGYGTNNAIKPDIVAPGASISTPLGISSGSSLATAIASGAVCQLFQWAVVERNNYFAESKEIKSYLARGAKRESYLSYPNPEWGYGRLDMMGTLDKL